MWFSKYFSKNKKPALSATSAVGLDDTVKQRIEQIITDVVWSGDTTFASRDDILDFVLRVVEQMCRERIVIDTTSSDIVISTPPSSEYELVIKKENVKIEYPEKVVRTKLKPLTFTKISDIVADE